VGKRARSIDSLFSGDSVPGEESRAGPGRANRIDLKSGSYTALAARASPDMRIRMGGRGRCRPERGREGSGKEPVQEYQDAQR